MTLISESVYIDKLDDTVNKCNNTYYKTMKMKPVEVKHNTYIDFIVLGQIRKPSNSLAQKNIIDKLLMRLLRLEFELDNTIK